MVRDITIILGAAYILTYALIYRREKLWGDMLFIILGFLTYYVTDSYIGTMLIWIALIVTVWDNTDKFTTFFKKMTTQKGDEW